MIGQEVVSSAAKAPRGGHLPPSARPARLPAVPVGPAPAPTDVELLALGVVVSTLDGMTRDEQRRALAFLTDRYGEAAR